MDMPAGGNGWPANIDSDIFRSDFARIGLDLLKHQPSQFGFHNGRGFTRGIAQLQSNAVISLRQSDRKVERLITCNEAAFSVIHCLRFSSIRLKSISRVLVVKIIR